MNVEVRQQRLHAAGQRVSPAGEQQSVATRVEAAQEGPDEATWTSACCEQREECQAPR